VLTLSGLVDTIIAGGPVMVPLALCSVIALGAFLERTFALRVRRVAPVELGERLHRLLQDGELAAAADLVATDASSLARMVGAAIRLRHLDREDLHERLEELGRHEAAALERFIPIVGTVASISPLLGLLGTVGGMIVTFATIQEQGLGDVDRLAGGISQALVTTFTGLSIGIPALIANRFLLARVDALLLQLEERVGRLVLLIRAHVEREARGK